MIALRLFLSLSVGYRNCDLGSYLAYIVIQFAVVIKNQSLLGTFIMWTFVCSTDKKTDIPGTDGYVPSLFPFSQKARPRPSATTAAAEYSAFPKTWQHI